MLKAARNMIVGIAMARGLEFALSKARNYYKQRLAEEYKKGVDDGWNACEETKKYDAGYIKNLELKIFELYKELDEKKEA